MVYMNSSITDQALLKNLNILLNSSTGLKLSLIRNFKIIQQYRQLQMKYTKLSHLTDSKLASDLDNVNTESIQNVINDYDTIKESQEFPYRSRIQKKVEKQRK